MSPLAPPPGEPRHGAKRYRTEIAAAVASLTSTIVSFPLFSAIRRQQSSKVNESLAKVITRTYQTEGIKGGLFRGLAVPLATVTASRTVSFSVYQQAKYKTSAWMGAITGKEEPLLVVNEPESVPTLATVTCFGIAGFFAGGAMAVVGSPFENITNTRVWSEELAKKGKADAKINPAKDVGMSQSYSGKNSFKTADQIYKNQGFRGFYTGFQLQIVRDSVGTAVYFMAYESAKQLLVKYQKAESPTPPGAVALAGGSCGIIGLLSTYPFDKAKSSYQNKILAGSKDFTIPKVNYFNAESWKGWRTGCLRSAITHGILFSVFEFVKRRINEIEDPSSGPDHRET